MIRYFISVVFKSALADRTHGLFPTERGENALSKRWQRGTENPEPGPQIRAFIEERRTGCLATCSSRRHVYRFTKDHKLSNEK